MFGYGYRQQGRRRGRCRGKRWIDCLPEITYFHPYGSPFPHTDPIILTMEELETLRLVDLENLTQEEAAVRMGVSRKTLWNDLQRARKKVVDALVNGRAISIQGGNYTLRTEYPHDFAKVKQILALLPGRNCGMCGYASCEDYAKAIASGKAPYDACKIADNEDKIREIMNRR